MLLAVFRPLARLFIAGVRAEENRLMVPSHQHQLLCLDYAQGVGSASVNSTGFVESRKEKAEKRSYGQRPGPNPSSATQSENLPSSESETEFRQVKDRLGRMEQALDIKEKGKALAEPHDFDVITTGTVLPTSRSQFQLARSNSTPRPSPSSSPHALLTNKSDASTVAPKRFTGDTVTSSRESRESRDVRSVRAISDATPIYENEPMGLQVTCCGLPAQFLKVEVKASYYNDAQAAENSREWNTSVRQLLSLTKPLPSFDNITDGEISEIFSDSRPMYVFAEECRNRIKTYVTKKTRYKTKHLIFDATVQ